MNKIISENAGLIKKLAILFVSLVVVDQITKILAQKYLENSAGIVIIPNVISLYFLRNEINHLYQYIVYAIINLVIFPAILVYSFRKEFSKVTVVGLILLWSAIFSNNIIDVFALGYVRDFIQLHGVATGNVADQYRTVGAVVVIIGLFRKEGAKLSAKSMMILISLVILLLILLALFWRYLAKFMAI